MAKWTIAIGHYIILKTGPGMHSICKYHATEIMLKIVFFTDQLRSLTIIGRSIHNKEVWTILKVISNVSHAIWYNINTNTTEMRCPQTLSYSQYTKTSLKYIVLDSLSIDTCPTMHVLCVTSCLTRWIQKVEIYAFNTWLAMRRCCKYYIYCRYHPTPFD